MLDAYCLPLSAAPGEPVSLHVSGDVGSCSIEVARDGADRPVVWRADAVEIELHPTPADAAATGCRWPAAIEIRGAGREGPRYAIEEMTDQRLVVFNL